MLGSLIKWSKDLGLVWKRNDLVLTRIVSEL